VAPDPDLSPARRAELMERLQAALDTQLGWLAEHGYEPAEAEWPVIRLESPAATLSIGYSPTHGNALTLGASLQEHGDPDSRSLGTLQRLSGVPEHPPRDWLVEDGDVETPVARLSAQLRTVEPLLAGDAAAFAAVRRHGSEALAHADLDEDLRVARPEARDAFRDGDFERVVALLEPLEGHLQRHEQGWLDHARRNRAS
jgi:hypothetical protein